MVIRFKLICLPKTTHYSFMIQDYYSKEHKIKSAKKNYRMQTFRLRSSSVTWENLGKSGTNAHLNAHIHDAIKLIREITRLKIMFFLSISGMITNVHLVSAHDFSKTDKT